VFFIAGCIKEVRETDQYLLEGYGYDWPEAVCTEPNKGEHKILYLLKFCGDLNDNFFYRISDSLRN